jgi:hypothetical protein
MCPLTADSGPPSPCNTASSEGFGSSRVLPGSSPITSPRQRRKPTRSQGPSLHRRYPTSTGLCPVRLPPRTDARGAVEAATLVQRGAPRYPVHLSAVPCPPPRRIERVLMSVASPSMQPSPKLRRVGIRIIIFEACSGFTHVMARRIAQPKAALVTRLRPGRLPDRVARQLPDPTDNSLGGSFLHW